MYVLLLGCAALNGWNLYFKMPADELSCFRRVNNIIHKAPLSSIHGVTELVLVFLFLVKLSRPSNRVSQGYYRNEKMWIWRSWLFCSRVLIP